MPFLCSKNEAYVFACISKSFNNRMSESSINEDLESCLPTSNFAHSTSNNNENEMGTLNYNVPEETNKKLDHISEVSKSSSECEANDDIDSSNSGSLTVNNAYSNCDHFSETSSQDLRDSGAEMETDITTKFMDCAVPNLSAEDELLMEINMQLPESEDLSRSQPPNGISVSVFNHPAYKTVIQELAQFKEQVSALHMEINRLEAENQRLETDRSHEIYMVQLETVEKTIDEQQKELNRLNAQATQQAEAFSQMKQDMENRLEKVTKQYEASNKDKEAMVMRYAVSEKEVIYQKGERELLEKKLREVTREKDMLLGKLKGASAEKARICQMLDVKNHELSVAQKTNEKLKEDLSSRDIKIKWAQNKLKTEMDAHKEVQAKQDKLVQKLQEKQEELDQVRRDCQAMMQAYQESQENRAHTLDQQLKEQQAKLILERHEREDKEEMHRQLQHEVDNLKRKHQLIIDENNLLSIKVQNLEKERLEYEQNLSKLKRSSVQQRQDVVDLQARLSEMESLKIQFQHEQEKLVASQGEVEHLRLSNAELQQDMAVCREREAELLDFTQKLTEKNVRLQSEFSATEAKAQQLECEQGPLQRQIVELENRVSSLSWQLEQEQQQRQEENQLLARHLAERTQQAEVLAEQLEDQKGENQVLRRKQASALKELTRELQHCRKKLDIYESSSGSNSLGQGSRASSCNSLNTVEGSMVNTSSSKVSAGGQSSPGNSGTSQASPPLEPDRQTLIERIVKLQRANARKTEKLDFMEEHTRQLVAELQKKARIVQNYIMREQSGVLSPASMDQNKADLSRHGGIMASVYGSRAVDNNMTLELSLEINRKLQSVLEDTLLKNITLKENIDTLGAEIARLTMEKQNTKQP
ncbi:coiled-coil domain-containing protein 186-like isoform X2 [Zootermopsis nevadensis]|uniref:coiled-coil domain-containing protein 186-like isoform X2 n=1 Tax=Zootermopsis nevadensis TaxID=136037 RepID=UPI000B8E4570|nr:coiled-coil domain-containing protein 186-like isoform X2 [Zootermopsis nevadensis]